MLQGFLQIKIHQFLALHRHVQGKFLRGQYVTAASIPPILSKIEQDFTAASAGIGAEDKDAKAAVAPVIFNYDDKVIMLISYWAVFLLSMKSVVDKSKLVHAGAESCTCGQQLRR